MANPIVLPSNYMEAFSIINSELSSMEGLEVVKIKVFIMVSNEDGIAYFHCGDQSFLLQDFSCQEIF